MYGQWQIVWTRLSQWAIATGALALIAQPTLAQDAVGNEGVQFKEDTLVEFEFLQSNGAYQASFGVLNLATGERTELFKEVKPSDSFQDVRRPSDYSEDIQPQDQNDFRGTPGNTVPEFRKEYLFKADTPYVFYLNSEYNGRSAGFLESSNPRYTRFLGRFEQLADGTGVVIRWDDTGSKLVQKPQEDQDYDDFIVIMGGFEKCRYQVKSNL